jgi:LysR family transcriptional activator of nhaA
LAPAMTLDVPIRFVCKENSLESLLGELALHKLDLIIADGPIPPHLGVRGFNHFLGECGTSFMAAPNLVEQGKADFPRSLVGSPFLIPSDQSLIQIQLLQWLEKYHIHPKIMGEFDDRALMKTFGQAGAGVFIVPSAIANEVAKQFQVEVIGSTEEIREQFFAIATEQRLSNPAIVAITDAAKGWLKHK